MFKTDILLLDSLKKGDERAYKQLYNLHYNNLVVYCHNLTKDQNRAKDIVQQTFVKIWIKKDSLYIKSSIKSYLYRAVYNTFLKEYQKIKMEEKALMEIKNGALLSLIHEDENIQEERMKLLELAIADLPRKNKEVFLLSKKFGYQYKEIAAELDISEKAVEKHISRAKKSIKEWFEKNKVVVFFILFRTKL